MICGRTGWMPICRLLCIALLREYREPASDLVSIANSHTTSVRRLSDQPAILGDLSSDFWRPLRTSGSGTLFVLQNSSRVMHGMITHTCLPLLPTLHNLQTLQTLHVKHLYHDFSRQEHYMRQRRDRRQALAQSRAFREAHMVPCRCQECVGCCWIARSLARSGNA